MASDIKEAIRRMIYQYSVEGADKVMATQQAVAASTTQTDKASLSLEKSFGNLERRYVDTVRAQQDYQKVQEKVNAAVAQNPALQDRANVVLAAASDHYDKLASRAGKSNLAISFTAKAFTQLIGAGGVMGLAMEGVGIAVAYVGEQFAKTKTTVEQALTEQNRLMGEAKKLIDEKTSAQDRMFAQSKDETLFQSLQNELDLRTKIAEMQRKTEAFSSTKTSPMTGEMGSEMAGLAPGPAVAGMEQLTAAIEKLRAATAAGQPGIAAFNAEIARIGLENPNVAELANQLLKAGQAGIGLEQAALKAQAMSDALNGVATNAQMAAAGLGSIAQFNLNNLNAQEAAYNLERMANEMDRLADKYPGINISTAKQLELLEAQLEVSRARTKEEELIAQEKLKVLQLTLEGKEAEDAALLAAMERRIAEETIARQKEQAAQREAAAAADRADREAEAAADASRAKEQALHQQWQQNAAAAEAEDRANAAAEAAQTLADNMHRAAYYTYQMVDALDAELKAFHSLSLAAQVEQRLRFLPTQFGDKQYTVQSDVLGVQRQRAAMEAAYGADMLKATTYFKDTMMEFTTYTLDMEKFLAKQQEGYPAMIGGMDVSSAGAASQTLANVLALGVPNGLGDVNRLIDVYSDPAIQANLVQQAIDYMMSTQPPGLAREEMINKLNQKLEQLASFDRQPQRDHAERAVAVLFARPAHHASGLPRGRGGQSGMAGRRRIEYQPARRHPRSRRHRARHGERRFVHGGRRL